VHTALIRLLAIAKRAPWRSAFKYSFDPNYRRACQYCSNSLGCFKTRLVWSEKNTRLLNSLVIEQFSSHFNYNQVGPFCLSIGFGRPFSVDRLGWTETSIGAKETGPIPKVDRKGTKPCIGRSFSAQYWVRPTLAYSNSKPAFDNTDFSVLIFLY